VRVVGRVLWRLMRRRSRCEKVLFSRKFSKYWEEGTITDFSSPDLGRLHLGRKATTRCSIIRLPCTISPLSGVLDIHIRDVPCEFPYKRV